MIDNGDRQEVVPGLLLVSSIRTGLGRQQQHVDWDTTCMYEMNRMESSETLSNTRRAQQLVVPTPRDVWGVCTIFFLMGNKTLEPRVGFGNHLESRRVCSVPHHTTIPTNPSLLGFVARDGGMTVRANHQSLLKENVVLLPCPN
mmetsp:Transcript_21390/g.49362  ORF Transcript_21390/g.49362 Transcript_21390/m.49362 type:complete len:144 (+) Transcript_21390:241-672(+)